MEIARKIRHYGWVICGTCFLLFLCTSGFPQHGLAVWVPFLKESLRLSGTETSFILTARTASIVLGLFLSRRFYQKFSLRAGMAFACFLVTAAELMMPRSVFFCCLGAVLMGISNGLGGTVPISAVTQNWFTDCRNIAAAISSSGSSAFVFLCGPVITCLAQRSVGGSFAAAAVFTAGCAALVWRFMRDTPEKAGAQRFVLDTREDSPRELPPRGREILTRRTDLFSLSAAAFLLGTGMTSMTSHIVIHIRTAGHSAEETAVVFSVYGGMMLLGKLLFGVTADTVGTYRANALFIGMAIVGVFLLSAADGTLPVRSYGGAVLFGLGGAIGTSGIMAWTADLPAGTDPVKNAQRLQILFSAGGTAGALFPGLIFDMTGSYAPALHVVCGVFLLLLLDIQALYRRRGAASGNV